MTYIQNIRFTWHMHGPWRAAWCGRRVSCVRASCPPPAGRRGATGSPRRCPQSPGGTAWSPPSICPGRCCSSPHRMNCSIGHKQYLSLYCIVAPQKWKVCIDDHLVSAVVQVPQMFVHGAVHPPQLPLDHVFYIWSIAFWWKSRIWYLSYILLPSPGLTFSIAS